MRINIISHGTVRHLLCAAALYFIVSAGQSAAQSSLTDSVHAIGEVTVAARSFREVIPSQKLQGEELARLCSHSVADALRLFAGVQVKDYGGVGGIKTINIRSMGSHHVGVFYDGVQLSNVQNGQVDLGAFSLDNIEAVTLHNGQRSEIFQSARDFNTAGTVYMWTRRPRFANGKSLGVSASVKTGSFDLVNPAASADLKLSPRSSVSFSAEHLRSSGEYTFRYRRQNPQTGAIVYDTTACRHNGDITATRVEAALFSSLPNAELYLKLYNYTSDRGVPGAIVNNVWRRGERIGDNNSFAQGTLTLTPQGLYKLKALGKWAMYRTHYQNNDTSSIKVDNRYTQREAYASAANLFRLTPAWDVSIALDAAWNDMTADLYNFAEPTRWTFMSAVATSVAWRGLKAQASLVVTLVSDRTERTADPPTRKAWTPAVFLSFRPGSCPLAVRAFAKKSFRMPTFNDLYYADMGNSILSPEKTMQYNAGLSLNLSSGILQSLVFQADVYYNEVTDKIVAYPKGQQFRWTMLNLGKVEIRGFDVSASASLAPVAEASLSAKLQYTLQQAIDVTSRADAYYRDQIPYVPRHSGSASLVASWRGWGLDYSFIYTGERWSQQENIIYNYVMPWYTHDVSLLRDFALRRADASLRIQVEVNNLLDQDYDVIVNYPMPGRNARLTLRYSM